MIPTFVYRAEYVSAYDGDTIRFNIDLGCDVWKMNQAIRLLGFNTPEVRGSSKKAGLIARDYVRGVLSAAKYISLETELDKSGSFGRLLANVYYSSGNTEWENLGPHLYQINMAEVYRG